MAATATRSRKRSRSKVAKKDQCKECGRKLEDSYCFPNSKSGWHYRYCPNTKGRCTLAAKMVRQ